MPARIVEEVNVSGGEQLEQELRAAGGLIGVQRLRAQHRECAEQVPLLQQPQDARHDTRHPRQAQRLVQASLFCKLRIQSRQALLRPSLALEKPLQRFFRFRRPPPEEFAVAAAIVLPKQVLCPANLLPAHAVGVILRMTIGRHARFVDLPGIDEMQTLLIG